MHHRLIFHWGNQILDQPLFYAVKTLLRGSKTVLIQYNGLLEFAHVVMIRRAVCYFLPSDLDLSQGCIGLFCPCYLFGKNAEFLGSGTLMGSCTTHFILWVLVNTICCLLTDGIFLGIPGCFVACYACGYRRALRSKYNLQEAPCGDFITHFFCHLCAICQEYREIRDKSAESGPSNMNLAIVTPPAVQTMELGLKE